MHLRRIAATLAFLSLGGCTAQPAEPLRPLPPVPPFEGARFAVIGDYGDGSDAEEAVARMVKDWRPDAIVTVGDNNYPSGSEGTIDDHIGKHYGDYIGAYRGRFGTGSAANRFFPSPGNHDWVSGLGPYLEYFDLPGNERYYAKRIGDAELFLLDSDTHEPDGTGPGSVQQQWLKTALAASDAPWKVVAFHHPPYSSCRQHRPSEWMRWPFGEWGADIVLSGHCHVYERLSIDELPYIVNGLGGKDAYAFAEIASGSVLRFNTEHGAQLVTVTPDVLRLEFYSTESGGTLVDRYELRTPQR